MDDCNEPDAGVWGDHLATGTVRNVSLELLFRACSAFREHGNAHMAGQLLAVLADRSARILRPRVGRDMGNQGEDVIKATVEKVVDAVLLPAGADAAGFAASFQLTLGRRLTDQIRRSRTHSDREVGFEADDDGDEIVPPDLSLPNPEQAMLIQELLSKVDPRKRRALALSAAGYPAWTDKPGHRSIASMLDVSRKTAETWLREMRCLVIKQMRE